MKKNLLSLLFIIVSSITANAQLQVFTDPYAANVSTNQFGSTYANFWSITTAEAHTGTSSIQVAVGGTGQNYTGGTIYSTVNKNLSSYNAVTFWIKADRAASLDNVGIGNSPSGATYKAFIQNIPITTSWQKIIIPIPDPSKLSSEKGFLFISEAAVDGAGTPYNFYIDDLQYETLSASDAIGATSLLSFTNETTTLDFAGMTFNTGATVDWTVGITNASNPSQTAVTLTLNRSYLSHSYIAGSSAIASIANNTSTGGSTITAVSQGSATIAEKLRTTAFTSGGQYTVTVNSSTVFNAAPIPPTPSSQVKNFYSDTYSTPVSITNWNTTSAGTVTEVSVAADKLQKIVFNATKYYLKPSNFGLLDVSAYNFVHIDIYTPSDITGTFGLKFGDGATTIKEYEAKCRVPIKNKWMSYDIPLSAYSAKGVDLTKLNYVLFVIGTNTNAAGVTFYIDNVYFSKTANYFTAVGGNIDNASSWGTNIDGTNGSTYAGAENNYLSSFTLANINYYIINNTSPTIGSNISIAGANSKMVVGNGTSAVNLNVPSSNSLTGNVDVANNSSLTLQNAIVPTLGNIGTNTTVSFAGSEAQQIPAATFYNLNVNNTAGCSLAGAVTVNSAFNLQAGSLTTGANNFSLGATATATLAQQTSLNITGGVTSFNSRSVTFQSGSAGTARLGEISGTLTGANNVTVERYIPANNRAYRFISPVVNTSSSIRDNWQEGVNNTSTSYSSNQDPHLGYGTHITGSATGANGFDATVTGNPSLRLFNSATQLWENISNTDVNTLNAGKGYLLFVRGNRSIDLNTSPAQTSTTLRATGALVSGQVTMNSSGVGATAGMPQLASNADEFSFIGNPYPSPVSWASLKAASSNLTNYYYIWDPSLSSRGAYVSTYTDGTKSNASSNVTVDIQQGQAFFVQNASTISGEPTVVFNENQKTTVSTSVFRQKTNTASLQIQLYLASRYPTATSQDAVLVLMNDTYDNTVTANDASKMDNLDENLAVSRNNHKMSIEQRMMPSGNDTIYLKLWQTTASNYTFKIDAANFPAGTVAYLQDAYLNSETPVNLAGTTAISFTADPANASSSDVDRFRIVFRAQTTLPTTFTSIKALKVSTGILVEWKTAQESNITEYVIEKSSDGINFQPIGKTVAKNSIENLYSYVDQQPLDGNNFYRVKSIDNNGVVKYTSIVSLRISNSKQKLYVINNPVINHTLVLQFSQFEKGNYRIDVTNALGQVILTRKYNHAGGTATYSLDLKDVAKGVYQVSVKGGGNVETKSFVW